MLNKEGQLLSPETGLWVAETNLRKLASAVLADCDDQETSWQESALCGQTDPETFSRSGVNQAAMPSAFAWNAPCVTSVSTTRSNKTKSMVFGVA